MWTKHLAETLPESSAALIALNPGSLLATKMVKEGFGAPAQDMSVGIDVMVRAAIGDEFSGASGQYFDNDKGHFAEPSYDATDTSKCAALVQALDSILGL